MLLVCVFVTSAVGIYLVLSGILRLPTLKSTRAITDSGRKKGAAMKNLDALFLDMAVWLSRYVRMEPYKRGRLESVLRAAGLKMSPEEYVSEACVRAGSVFLCIIPGLYIFPMISLPILLLGILVYYRSYGRAEEMVKERREEIDGELYRFVLDISQELQNSRDVLSMLEHYKERAGEAFRAELDIVCADMRSSSYEAALTRLEARVNSPRLSDTVRGLIGVLRGDDGTVYFQMLSHDFKQAELQRLKTKAAGIPPKIRVYSLVMLLCFMATYFVLLIYEIIRSIEIMF